MVYDINLHSLCGVVWGGVVWCVVQDNNLYGLSCGVVWCGMVQCGMVYHINLLNLYGVVWCVV